MRKCHVLIVAIFATITPLSIFAQERPPVRINTPQQHTQAVESIAPMTHSLGKVSKDFAADVWLQFVKPYASSKTGITKKDADGNGFTTSNAIINKVGGLVFIDLHAVFTEVDEKCAFTLSVNVGSMVFEGQVYQEKAAGVSEFIDAYIKLLKREVLKLQMRDQQAILRLSVKKKAKNEREMARLAKSIETLEQRIFKFQNTISDDKASNEQLKAIIENQKEVLEAMQTALNADLPKA